MRKRKNNERRCQEQKRSEGEGKISKERREERR